MGIFRDVFPEAAREAMHFLEVTYAFREVEMRVIGEDGATQVLGSVTYADSSAQDSARFVTLSVAPLRLELDLDVGIGGDRREFYTVYELHQLEGRGQFPSRQHDLYKAIHDRQQLLYEFEILTTVLRTCGSRFFAGEISLWEDLRKQRSLEAQTRDDQRASQDAETAFKAHNWQRVVALLERRESRLTKLDSSRLRYARKQLGTVK
jgi:hypothetical protein